MIDYSDIESIVDKCFKEMDAASISQYDSIEADKTAALFLVAQMKVSSLIEDVEMQARQAKNEISRVEGEKYFEYKTSNNDKKITENMLVNYVAKDPDIIKTKNAAAVHEASLKKWNYVMGILKESHLYFRNIAKNKNWSE